MNLFTSINSGFGFFLKMLLFLFQKFVKNLFWFSVKKHLKYEKHLSLLINLKHSMITFY